MWRSFQSSLMNVLLLSIIVGGAHTVDRSKCQEIYENTLSLVLLTKIPFQRTEASSSSVDSASAFFVGPVYEFSSGYIALTQLNVSNPGSVVQTNCNYYSQREQRRLNFQQPKIADLLHQNPNAKFVSSKINVDEWYRHAVRSHNRDTRTVPIAIEFDKSYVPEAPVDIMDAIDVKRLSLAVVNSIFEAYYEYISCMVPEKQLFWTTESSDDSSDNYWRNLIQFLEIPLSDFALNRLIQGGIPRVINGQCYTGNIPCQFWTDRSKPHVIVPSMCGMARHYGVVQVTAPKLATCATDYVNEMVGLYGEQHRPTLEYKLMRPVVVQNDYDSNAQIVLNIGPGSSGTRSLFTAMRQLNVTSRHYVYFSANCGQLESVKKSFGFRDQLEPLALSATKRIFWGDIPVPERWWHLLSQYPHTTKFIMTDIDSDKWYHSRSTQHCRPERPQNTWNGCTPPVPFSFAKHRSHAVNKTERIAAYNLLNATHLTMIDKELSAKTFDAYRRLIRCAVPPSQLLWIDMTKQTNATEFWTRLTRFMEMQLTPSILSKLMAAGVPYLGGKGCRMGVKNCTYVDKNRRKAIIPSVCAPE